MIIRSDKAKGNFTQMSNDIINRNDLSWEAKGLMFYLLSKPDNWNFYTDEIIKHCNCGIKKLRGMMGELKELGYLEIIPIRSNGKFNDYEWIVTEEPKRDSGNNVEESITPTRIPKTASEKRGSIVIRTNTNTKSNDIKDNSQRGAIAPSGFGAVNLIGKSVVELYFKIFEERFGEHHVKISKVRLNSISKLFSDISRDIGVDLDMWDHMIRFYMFTARFKIDVDYNINHFTSNGILSVYLEREFGKPVLDPSYIA